MSLRTLTVELAELVESVTALPTVVGDPLRAPNVPGATVSLPAGAPTTGTVHAATWQVRLFCPATAGPPWAQLADVAEALVSALQADGVPFHVARWGPQVFSGPAGETPGYGVEVAAAILFTGAPPPPPPDAPPVPGYSAWYPGTALGDLGPFQRWTDRGLGGYDFVSPDVELEAANVIPGPAGVPVLQLPTTEWALTSAAPPTSPDWTVIVGVAFNPGDDNATAWSTHADGDMGGWLSGNVLGSAPGGNGPRAGITLPDSTLPVVDAVTVAADGTLTRRVLTYSGVDLGEATGIWHTSTWKAFALGDTRGGRPPKCRLFHAVTYPRVLTPTELSTVMVWMTTTATALPALPPTAGQLPTNPEPGE